MDNKNMYRSPIFFAFLSLGLIAPSFASDSAEQLQQARLSLNNGDAQSAYQLLLPLENELAGTPSYDTLLGQAALRVNQGTRAAMAFERCLMVQPKNGDCRLGLAQTHIQLNESTSAIHELNVIKQSAPPEQIAQVVDSYLGQLSGNQIVANNFKAWAELTLGYDDNTNIAPSSSTVMLPGSSVGGIGISFKTDKDDSVFMQVGLGASYTKELTSRWDLLAGANFQTTHNFAVEDNSYFDKTDQLSGYVGASSQYGKQRYGLMMQGQHYRIHGDSYRNVLGFVGQYNYLYSPRTQLTGFLQRNRLNYQYSGNEGLQDVDATTLGGSVAHSLFNNQMVVFAGGYLGQDSKVKSAASDNIESDFWGVRGGATWIFQHDLQAHINLLNENRKYDGNYILQLGPIPFAYDKERQDHLISTELGLTWKVLPQLQLRPQVSYLKNNSNIAARDYDRSVISLGVRYDFL